MRFDTATTVAKLKLQWGQSGPLTSQGAGNEVKSNEKTAEILRLQSIVYVR